MTLALGLNYESKGIDLTQLQLHPVIVSTSSTQNIVNISM